MKIKQQTHQSNEIHDIDPCGGVVAVSMLQSFRILFGWRSSFRTIFT